MEKVGRSPTLVHLSSQQPRAWTSSLTSLHADVGMVSIQIPAPTLSLLSATVHGLPTSALDSFLFTLPTPALHSAQSHPCPLPPPPASAVLSCPNSPSFCKYFLIPLLYPALGKLTFEEGGGNAYAPDLPLPFPPTHSAIFLKLITESANDRV